MTKTSSHATYRVSGVEWLGSIPAHWSVTKFRHCFRESSEVNGTNIVGEMLSVSGFRGVEAKVYEDENQKRDAEQLESYRVVRKGQLAVNTMWLNYSGLGISDYDGHMSPAYRAYWVTREANLRYIHYLMRSRTYVDGYTSFLTGIRPNSLQMSRANLMEFPIILPPRNEQDAIAAFLDRETTHIDGLIGKQEQLIELLAEKRGAIITHAVTKGLAPCAPAKPSGVPWQGSVPEHWTIQPLKNLMRMQTGVTLGKDFAQDVTETYAYLRVANVQIGHVDLNDVKEIDLPPEVAASSMLQSGDVLMTEGGDRDKLARGCIWDGSISPCVHQNHIFAVRTGPQLLSSFLVLVLDAAPARTYFYLTGKQSTNLASTNSTTVKNFKFGLPPMTEQSRIVEYLNVKTRQIDDLMNKASAVAAVLRERRSALISAAVTGKINVTNEGVAA